MAKTKRGIKLSLDKKAFATIREGVLKGKTLKKIANDSQISYSTLTGWIYRNEANLRDRLEGWRRDRKLNLAENNIEKILEIGVEDGRYLKIVADTSKFVIKRLGGYVYSRKLETQTNNRLEIIALHK